MKLISSKSVLDSMGYDNIQRITDIIDSALENADVELQSLLRTGFGETVRTDVFHVVSSAKFANSTSRTVFLLNQGFVQATPAYTVTAATTREGLAESSAIDLRAVAAVDKTTLALEKGLLAVDGYDLSGFFVEVGYTAGFDVDADDDEMYDQTLVPAWLKTAARLSVSVEAATNRKVARMGLKEGEYPPSTVPLRRSLSHIIDSHVRYEPLARKAIA